MSGELRALRSTVAKLEARQSAGLLGGREAALGMVLAGCLLVLTAVTWAVDDDDDEVYTLWGLVSDGGWIAFAVLSLVCVLGVGSLLVFVDDSSRAVHLSFVVLGLLAATGTLFVTVPEDSDTAPGRWLTLLASVALTSLHGKRAGDLRRP